MKPFQGARAVLAAIGFVLMMSGGYLAFNYFISCNADAQCHCSLCTPPGAMSTAISNDIRQVIQDAMDYSKDDAIIPFFDEIHPPWADQTPPKAQEVTDNQIAWWDTFFYYNLRPAMQAMTDQLGVAELDGSRMTGAMNDALDMNRTLQEVAQQEVETHREMRPSETLCVGANTVGGMTDAATMTAAYNEAAPLEFVPRGTNAVGTPAAKGAIADQAQRWTEYTAKYCDPNTNAGNSGCTAAGTLVNRDLDVTGEIFDKDTIYMNDPDVAMGGTGTKTVVDDMIKNIAEPIVSEPIPPEVVDTVQGKKALMDLQSIRARRQTVFDVMYHVVSRRVPSSAASQLAQIIQPMRGSFLYATGLHPARFAPPAGLPYRPSHNEVMEVMMGERFRSGAYSLSQIDEPENNAREIVQQQAFQAMQWNDQLDLLDRWSIMLAGQVGGDSSRYVPDRSEGMGTR